MSSKGGAVRQPASDLTAFDVSKRSPEDIARLFARWKEQRKSLQTARPDVRVAAGTPKSRPRLMPVMGRDAAPLPAAAAEEALDSPAKTARSVRYSAPFAAVLETGASGALADRLDNLPFAAAQKSRAAHLGTSSVRADDRSAVSRAKRRSRSRWILAGAASILAVAAASGALWLPSPRTGSNETPASVQTATPIVTPARNAAAANGIATPAAKPPIAARMAGRLLPAATRSPVSTASPLQAAIDAGLMRPLAPDEAVHEVRLAPKLKPPVPEVQTASKTPAEQSPEPIAASGVEIEPEAFLPGRPVSRSPSAVSVAIPAALTPQSGAEDEADPGTRPEALYRRGNDKGLIGDDHRGSHPQHGANDSRPSPGAGFGRQGDDSGSSAGGGASSGGSGTGSDPSSGTGGGTGAGGSNAGGGTTGSGASGSTGSGTGGTGGTGDAGSGSGTGDTGSNGDSGAGGSGSTSGGSAGGATGGGDTGGSTGGDTGGSTGGATGGNTGGDTGGATGGSDTGDGTGSGSGDSGSSDSGSGDSGSSDSGGLSGHADVDVGGGGISGSVGGSIGGIGGSIGGSIGGGGGKIGGGLKL